MVSVLWKSLKIGENCKKIKIRIEFFDSHKDLSAVISPTQKDNLQPKSITRIKTQRKFEKVKKIKFQISQKHSLTKDFKKENENSTMIQKIQRHKDHKLTSLVSISFQGIILPVNRELQHLAKKNAVRGKGLYKIL